MNSVESGQTRSMLQVLLGVLVSMVTLLFTRRQRRRRRLPAQAVIISSPDASSIARDGAVRSVQSAELTVPREYLESHWSAPNLENLARTYWRFLSRVTLGLIRVTYGENERAVVLLGRPLTVLRFDAPHYEMRPDYGRVRWQIRDGLLVARSGRGSGFLTIEVHRLDDEVPTSPHVKLRIDIEVANFYPAIAAGFGTIVYEATQSAIHLLVTHAFLRSLATLDLAQSKVGRLTVPDPAQNGGAPEVIRSAPQ